MILVGEMRDEETVRTALSAAETGHLVLSTIHTVDAAESVNRIIDFFPQAEQRQARAMLAGTLKAVISQRLVPTPDRNGRVATCEILRMTGRVRDMIMNPEETGKLPRSSPRAPTTACRPSTRRCSTTCSRARVAMEDALKAATHPHDFKLLVSSDGLRSTSVESVIGTPRRSSRTPRVERRRAERHRRARRVTRTNCLDAVGHPAQSGGPHPIQIEGGQVQSTLGEFQETQSEQPFALQNSKLLKVSLEPGHDPGEGRIDGRLPGRRAFEHAGSGGLSRMVKKAVSGEGTTLMKMSGTGEVFLADTAQDIHLIYLENDAITVNGANLLAFDAGIDWDIKRVEGVSGMMGGGLFNTALHGHRLGGDHLRRAARAAQHRRRAHVRGSRRRRSPGRPASRRASRPTSS